jgi:hypothetical protein
MAGRGVAAGAALMLGTLVLTQPALAQQQANQRLDDPTDVELPAGYELEAVAKGLSYATDVAFDDKGNV